MNPLIGASIPQVTGRQKVLGLAQYVADLKFPGMLHGKVLRSPYAHARIVHLDTSRARALKGVKVVVTGTDTPARRWVGPQRAPYPGVRQGPVRWRRGGGRCRGR